MKKSALSHLTWPEIAKRSCDGSEGRLLFVVPVGSCEQHGPHLPFNVDTEVATAVSTHLSRQRHDVLLGPAVAYGASGEHEAFAGTVSVSHEVLAGLFVEIGRSVSRWATRTLFISGHGGNLQTLMASTTQLRSEGRDAAWWLCSVPNGDAHAGRSETSLMLVIQPSYVCLELACPGEEAPIGALMPVLRQRGVLGVSPNGVLGNPVDASRAEGLVLLADLQHRLCADVEAWVVADDGRLGDGGCPPRTAAADVLESLRSLPDCRVEDE